MATLVGTPQVSNSEGLAGLSTPISYSKETGLALQLANMLASAGQVVPYMRKLTPAQYLTGDYPGTKPDGYVAGHYKLSMLEMPETIAVYDDVLKVCQPVMVYQVGTPTQLITTNFPVILETGTFTIGGKAVPAVSEGQSVLLRFYKNANVAIIWNTSNITNNGLTDEVITSTTELAFIVTYLNGAYRVTEWLSPNFITTQLNTLKTAKKNNFASIINELFDKIPAPVTLPTYDSTTLKLANNILSVILAPQATKAGVLNNAFTVVDFTDLNGEGIDLNNTGETCIFRWGGESYSPPPGYTDETMPGFGIAMRANANEYYLLAMCRKSKVSAEFNLSIGVSQVDGGGIDWTQIGGAPNSYRIDDFKNVSAILAQLKDNQVASIYNTGSLVQNGPTGTSTFGCLGTIQKGSAGGYVNAIFHVTNVAGGTNLQSYIGVLCSNSTSLKWVSLNDANERILLENWSSGFSTTNGSIQITTREVVNSGDKIRVQGQIVCGDAEPATAFDVTGVITEGGVAVLTQAAYRWDDLGLAILIFECLSSPDTNQIQLRWFLDNNTYGDYTKLTIHKITKVIG
jgi:hypothetical protein